MATTKAHKTAARLQGELDTCRQLNDELRGGLGRVRSEADTYMDKYFTETRRNKELTTQLRHQQRLVRTLLDVLADQKHPLPTNVQVSLDYKVASESESEASK